MESVGAGMWVLSSQTSLVSLKCYIINQFDQVVGIVHTSKENVVLYFPIKKQRQRD